VDKRGHDPAVRGAAAVAPLGMELEAPGEAARVAPAERLDEAVVGVGFGDPAVAEPLDALRMQRADAEARAAGEPLELAARDHGHRVPIPVLRVERLVGILAVHDVAAAPMQVLVQAAAEGDVQLVRTAAEAD